MEPAMIKFPSIEQSRQVLPSITLDARFTHVDPDTHKPCYDVSAHLPVLEFRGTVKLHGSNAAMVQVVDPTGGKSVHFQSRERILSLEKDLMGFCAFMSMQLPAIDALFESLTRHLESVGGSQGEKERSIGALAIFGEWCGTGIQKGVALSKLPKMFVIFVVKVLYAGEEGLSTWLDVAGLPGLHDERSRIYNIVQFPTFQVTIDFNDGESLVEAKKQIDAYTLGVEDECPAGKHFGVSGTGEGIVWKAIGSPTLSAVQLARYTDSRFWFKSKGVKHTKHAKPETAKKASLNPETATRMEALVELVLSPGRLQQGLQVLEREKLLPLEMKSIGHFIKWVNADVLKEDHDRVEESGLDQKAVSTALSAAAKKWYVEYLEDVKNWGVK